VVVNKDGRLKADPAITLQGVVEAEREAEMKDAAIAAAQAAVEKLSQAERRDDALAREAVRLAVRRLLHDRLGKKPQTEVQLIRV
jgi:ribonuclease J